MPRRSGGESALNTSDIAEDVVHEGLLLEESFQEASAVQYPLDWGATFTLKSVYTKQYFGEGQTQLAHGVVTRLHR